MIFQFTFLTKPTHINIIYLHAESLLTQVVLFFGKSSLCETKTGQMDLNAYSSTHSMCSRTCGYRQDSALG
jgi:hypothetical protein